MTYIKLLTVLAGLALLTACGGAAAPKTDNTGGDTTTDCETNAFHADCDAVESAISSRRNMCLSDSTTDDSCDEVIVGACKANPFQTGVCLPDDTYLPLRIADCITEGKADGSNCREITKDATKNTALTDCLTNPFDVACESLDDFTTFALARTNRLTFCDNSANVDDDLCTGDNVGIICGTDPFNAICFTGNTYFSARVNNCITAGNANSNNNCNTVFTESASNTCLTNPFTDACTSDADFGTYATIARMARVTFCGTNSSDTICDTLTACQNNPFATECEAYFQTERDNRESFCDMAGNVGNALCMGASRVGVCGSDPFNASCFTEPTYLTARVNNCITGGNAGDMKCDIIVSDSTMNAEITACLTNPFTDTCASNPDFDDYADMARENRVAFCESGSGEICTALTTCQGNPFHESCGAYFESAKIPHCAIRTNAGGDCATTLSRPNAATWAQSFATELSATPTTGTGFLRGMETGLNTGDATTISHNIILNLATTTYEGVALGGDKEDGATYFIGNSGLNSYYYAGILSGTNLGAPLTETTGEATWNGRISARGAFNVDSDFNLAITFGGTGDIAGTLTAFASGTDSVSLPAYYKIDAEFDNKGLIIATEGNIIWNTFTDRNPETPVNNNNDRASGTLTGLIGQEGAVGVFILERAVGNGTGYYGGFVARPAP